MKKLSYKDILHTKQFSREDLELIFDTADKMQEYLSSDKKDKLLEGKIMASMFYEPSTRTRLSFESAMLRLGGKVITVSGADSSSLSKGESLSDNAKTIALYSDIITMRHPEPYSVRTTAQSVNIPVINAGDGPHQHPTQALLDVYTILQEKGKLDNLKISLVGDLKYGRTTHSIVFLMGLFKNTQFTFISPEELQMPKKVLDFLDKNNIKYNQIEDYTNGVKDADILYVTRIQKERFTDTSQYEELKNKFILDKNIISLNSTLSIMHPFPRVNEIKTEVDSLPNAAYFRQAKNGVPIRMALLYLLLK